MSQETNSQSQPQSYYQQRMQLLGITPDQNKVGILQYDMDSGQNIIKEIRVFTQSTKGIDILVYTLNRSIIKAERPRESKSGSDTWKEAYKLTRLETPVVRKDGSIQKYNIPKGAGTHPFFHPSLIKKFEEQTPIDTLFITEGYFKAWKACAHGMDVVGVTSITHLKENDKNELHTDILRLRDVCQVKRMVWLTDGDCLDITSKDLTDGLDLFKRPRGFWQSCQTFYDLLDTWDGDKWFYHINSDNLCKDGITRDQVKGLDDIMITFPDRIPEIVTDSKTVTGNSDFFVKQNISTGCRRIYSYFHLLNVNDFYTFHVERRKDLEKVEFVFNGTRYKYNDEEKECKVIVPGAAKLYFRVGDVYYKFVEKVDEEGRIQTGFEKRLKSTIEDDHGKKFAKHIPKYEAFCNVPSHTDYQQVIHNNFNVYFPFEHEPDANVATEEDCKYIISFLKHVFGTKLIDVKQKEGNFIRTEYYQLALDYIQLLYQKPTKRLPILCLVSKENETGKSTFGDLLKAIFTNNATTVGNSDLADDFNSFWATKLLVMCDETKIDKQAVVEKVKSLTFAKKIGLNSKGRDKIEIPFFGKFMFFTNNEENFIYASEEDLRYWVIKVPKLKEKNPELLNWMYEEIPAFLSMLNNRKMVTPSTTRMWFHPDLLRTEALKKVIEWSHSTVKKELRYNLKHMFLDFGVEQIHMSLSDIRDNFFKNKEANYIERVLKEEMQMLPFHVFKVGELRQEFTTEGEAIAFAKGHFHLESDLQAMGYVKRVFKTRRYSYPRYDKKHDMQTGKTESTIVSVSMLGRPYVFHRKDFIPPNEDSEVPDDLKIPAGADDELEPASPQEDLPF